MTSWIDRAHQHVSAALHSGHPGPGCAVALVAEGRTARVASHGVRSTITKAPVSAHTAFQIGSLTKVITATAALRVAEAGAFDIDAPVNTYIDWFEAEGITARHLLSHTSGLPGFVDTLPPSRLAVWKVGRGPTAPPGRFHYSNMGYMALGYAIEAATGTAYPEVVATEVFRPLDMGDATGDVPARPDTASAAGHFRDERTGEYQPFPHRPFVGAHASVRASASDMARFLHLLIDGGWADGSFLDSGSLAQLTDPAVTIDDGPTGYGMGLFTQGEGPATLYHGGENEGFESALIIDRQRGIGVVVLVNSFDDPWPLARFALETLRRAAAGETLPAAPDRALAELAPTRPTTQGTSKWSHITLVRSAAVGLSSARAQQRPRSRVERHV